MSDREHLAKQLRAAADDAKLSGMDHAAFLINYVATSVAMEHEDVVYDALMDMIEGEMRKLVPKEFGGER